MTKECLYSTRKTVFVILNCCLRTAALYGHFSLRSLQNSEILFGRTKLMASLEKFFHLRKGLLIAKKYLLETVCLTKHSRFFTELSLPSPFPFQFSMGPHSQIIHANIIVHWCSNIRFLFNSLTRLTFSRPQEDSYFYLRVPENGNSIKWIQAQTQGFKGI